MIGERPPSKRLIVEPVEPARRQIVSKAYVDALRSIGADETTIALAEGRIRRAPLWKFWRTWEEVK